MTARMRSSKPAAMVDERPAPSRRCRGRLAEAVRFAGTGQSPVRGLAALRGSSRIRAIAGLAPGTIDSRTAATSSRIACVPNDVVSALRSAWWSRGRRQRWDNRRPAALGLRGTVAESRPHLPGAAGSAVCVRRRYLAS